MFNTKRKIRFASKLVIALLLFSFIQSIFVSDIAHAVSGAISSGSCSTTIGEVSTALITQVDNDCVLTFKTGNNSWTIPNGISSFRYLVVAGGGGGAGDRGGGGGAGGFLTDTTIVSSGVLISVVVGSGGAGSTGYNQGSNGSNSTISGSGITTITAIGGGGGGYSFSNTGKRACATSASGKSGGSGGGAGSYSPNYNTEINGCSGGSATTGQGNAGGGSGSPYAGLGTNPATNDNQYEIVRNTGGGGGAGGVGISGQGGTRNSNPVVTVTGVVARTPDGGAGLSSNISGVTKWYAGGGGGSCGEQTGNPYFTAGAGVGGSGGGGNGAPCTGGVYGGSSGVMNTGGGGGGGTNGGTGGTGGSGVVIIRYALSNNNDSCTPTKSSSGDETVLIFKNVGTCNWAVPSGVSSVRYLIVAGGGGGASNRGGGGGAGGMLGGGNSDTAAVTSGASMPIVVGAGGAGGAGAGANTSAAGSAGSNSSFNSLTAIGGGGGGRSFSTCGIVSGSSGGSGGGAGIFSTPYGGGATGCPGGSATTGQGNAGGGSGSSYASLGSSGLNYDYVRNSAGGGGAGAVGKAGQGGTRRTGSLTVTGVSAVTPDGGIGLQSNITGSNAYYAGGGGGAFGYYNYVAELANYYSAGAGAGGLGGGGAGSDYIGAIGTAGTANTGGGGGGGGFASSGGVSTSFAGGAGGSGVVILRFLNTKTITFDGNSSTSGTTATQTVASGTNVNLTANGFTKTSNLFTGWNTSSDGSGVSYGNTALISTTQNLTLYAQWSAVAATIIYFDENANGDAVTGIPVAQVKNPASNATISALTPTRTGYTFDKWYPNSSGTGGESYAAGATYASNNSITLYAKWTANSNNAITWDDQTPTTASSGGSSTYTTDLAVTTIPTTPPIKTGYTFGGWWTGTSGSGTQVTNGSYTPAAPYGSKTFYANWTASTYAIAYWENVSSSGTAPTDQYRTHDGAAVTISTNSGTLVKTGYTFSGWNTATDGSGTNYAASGSATYSVNADIVLNAKWTANSNNAITWDDQTPTTASSGGSSTYTTDLAVTTIPTTPPIKTGYTFGGWWTGTSGSGTQVTNGSYTPAAPYGSKTFYAKWTSSGSQQPTPTPIVEIDPRPSYSTVSSSYGSTEGGTILVVNGVNLSGAIATLNGKSLSITSSSDGQLTIETPANPEGSVTIEIKNSKGSFALPFTYLLPPTITAPELPYLLAGEEVNLQFTGNNVDSYSLKSGLLPPGVSLNSATGKLTGASRKAGSYSFEISATNKVGSKSVDILLDFDKQIPKDIEVNLPILINQIKFNTEYSKLLEAFLKRAIELTPNRYKPIIYIEGGSKSTSLYKTVDQLGKIRHEMVYEMAKLLKLEDQGRVDNYCKGSSGRIKIVISWTKKVSDFESCSNNVKPEVVKPEVVKPEVVKPATVINKTLKVYFDMGSAVIKPDQRTKIVQFAKLIRQEFKSVSNVTVLGYAQPTAGSNALDQELSRNRALNVANLLKKLGITKVASIKGLGRTEINKSSSRYVQITVKGLSTK
jgi:uncharacterized repeat protein (TIGR02543 family)